MTLDSVIAYFFERKGKPQPVLICCIITETKTKMPKFAVFSSRNNVPGITIFCIVHASTLSPVNGVPEPY